MSQLIKPFITTYDFSSGAIMPEGKRIVRRLSDMWEMYQDADIAKERLTENPLIYEVYNVELPENEEHVQHCTTILYPGKVGKEYFMTKGHYHEIINRAEIYFCLKGSGLLVMQTKEGEFSTLEMIPGSIAYVPPYWAHRTVNTGDEPFVFFAAYPGDAGHNYGEIETEGFAKVVLEHTGAYLLADNLKYTK
ncbi:glucose-6-phosphate isomerase family protein [Paenibacillus sp. N3.4]|uniref:glucose-6-phosphate isomerase family protein n=1 Tax=Paenibacillus sp. N3.4 TaxID=2603222 RepID=UPI0011C85203|nr:glucose-6-phosphate isomerase family protein [Paenibacillus sp. N3.4]TXK77190.1 cupin domain-containing protein [Paenibacillus sp. N3.4]